MLGLAAVCDTMTECSRPAWRPAASPGHRPAVRGIPPGLEPDDTIPDVPAWDGTAPDAVLPDGSVPPGRPAGIPAYDGPLSGPGRLDDLDPESAAPGRAGDPRDDAAGPDHPGLGGLAGRVLLTALTMPPGGRVLLVVVAAPIFGAQPALVGLLDWGIIAVGFGIGSRTAVRRRDRKADERARGAGDLLENRAEPGSLALLLLPAGPAESPDWPVELPSDADFPAAAELSPDGRSPAKSGVPPGAPVSPGTPSRPDPQVPPATQVAPVTAVPSVTQFQSGSPVTPVSPVPQDPPARPGDQLPADPQLPVVRVARPPAGITPEPAGLTRGGGADDDTDRAADASELPAAALFEGAAFAGEPSVGIALGLSYISETGAARYDSARPGSARPGRPARQRPAQSGSGWRRPGPAPGRRAGPRPFPGRLGPADRKGRHLAAAAPPRPASGPWR